MIKKIYCLMSIIIILIESNLSADDKLKEQFEVKYKAWKNYVSSPELKIQSRATTHFTCPQFQEMVKLGVPALPYIAEKMEANNDQLLWKAMEDIAKVKIRGKYDIEKNMLVFSDFPEYKTKEDVYLYWYRSGRKQTPQRFNQLYTDWRSLKKQGKTNEANEKYQRMCDLGIDALPLVMQQIEQGDKDLIPVVSYFTDNNVKSDIKPSDCLNWWNNNKDKWTLPPVK